MVQVTLLLDEITGLALFFSKGLVQPIQDRVHPSFEYWDCQDGKTRPGGRTARSPGMKL